MYRVFVTDAIHSLAIYVNVPAIPQHTVKIQQNKIKLHLKIKTITFLQKLETKTNQKMFKQNSEISYLEENYNTELEQISPPNLNDEYHKTFFVIPISIRNKIHLIPSKRLISDSWSQKSPTTTKTILFTTNPEK